jgi:formiminoglutamase
MAFAEIINYLEPTHFVDNNTNLYSDAQYGASIVTDVNSAAMADAAIIIIGVNDSRSGIHNKHNENAADSIRDSFYKLYNWHPELSIGDLGNLKIGKTTADTRAALNLVMEQLYLLGKVVIVLGGSHDFTLSQYHPFKSTQQIINAAVVDKQIDLADHEMIMDDNFLYELLTSTPNYISQFNLLGFQSYYSNPTMLNTLNKLHFSCHRLGMVQENLYDMEPYLRTCHIMSIDINAMAAYIAPGCANVSPNGLAGDEACQLAQFVGSSSTCSSIGLYGYVPSLDKNNITAGQIAQMMWYFIDGLNINRLEAKLSNTDRFNTYHVEIPNYPITFIQSKITGRWWMQLPNEKFAPCSQKDYNQAAQGEMPDRWLKEIDRINFQGS